MCNLVIILGLDLNVFTAILLLNIPYVFSADSQSWNLPSHFSLLIWLALKNWQYAILCDFNISSLSSMLLYLQPHWSVHLISSLHLWPSPEIATEISLKTVLHTDVILTCHLFENHWTIKCLNAPLNSKS